ncbi:hypothetical protein E2C01_078307 [Portunus trituberculatus]|uniref:Uncharacterized protein n=1 Tax=Portunus trituberculatus TaxID=210409 RepID=A0A5B7IML9_PORTR|nr:hypothetical protein [Portunus trituberculatus]
MLTLSIQTHCHGKTSLWNSQNHCLHLWPLHMMQRPTDSLWQILIPETKQRLFPFHSIQHLEWLT